MDENVRKKFEDAVTEAKEYFEEKGIFLVCDGSRLGRFQYSGEIYWHHWSFSEEIIKKLNDKYIGVTGFNIMPYRITKSIVVKAVDSGEKDENIKRSFKEKIKSNKEYCDFDKNSGNFHKLPDRECQIVLTEGSSGPGWKGEVPLIDDDIIGKVSFDEKYEIRRKKIKENYYFPGIDDDTKADNCDGEYIIKLVKDALTALGISID